ncbi:MAG TPA: hypothetical protein PKM88_08040 [bacterium]|nr:hypothetical protein [bacterium]
MELMTLGAGLVQFFPDAAGAVRGAAAAAAAFVVAAPLAAYARRAGRPVGDTRKLFHVIIFTAAAALRYATDGGTLAVYGSVVAAGILVAVWRGDGEPLFEALAREEDAPHRAWFVVVPLAATAIGGVLAQLIAGPAAPVAYLVGGWGDAVGEPAGKRWGRHRFMVPRLKGVPAVRTVEGCLAVFTASWLAAGIAFVALGTGFAAGIGLALVVAVVATAVEAVSPHGLDNLTIMVAVALLARWLTR